MKLKPFLLFGVLLMLANAPQPSDVDSQGQRRPAMATPDAAAPAPSEDSAGVSWFPLALGGAIAAAGAVIGIRRRDKSPRRPVF